MQTNITKINSSYTNLCTDYRKRNIAEPWPGVELQKKVHDRGMDVVQPSLTIPMHFLKMRQMLKSFLENIGAGRRVLEHKHTCCKGKNKLLLVCGVTATLASCNGCVLLKPVPSCPPSFSHRPCGHV